MKAPKRSLKVVVAVKGKTQVARDPLCEGADDERNALEITSGHVPVPVLLISPIIPVSPRKSSHYFSPRSSRKRLCSGPCGPQGTC